MEDARRTRWRHAIMEDKSLKKPFAYVTNKRLLSVASIKNADGSTPINELEMEEALGDFWNPIFNPTRPVDEKLLNDQVLAKYWKWGRCERVAPDISYQALQSAVLSMRSSSSPGPGGWRVCELKSLPTQCWIELSFLVHLFEHETFPRALQEVWISLIPKGEGGQSASPGDLRPIAVAGSVYRAYSRAKACALSPVIEDFLHPCQHGARPGRCLHHGVAAIATALESSKAGSSQWHGFSLDFSKCFDMLPSSVIATVLALAGVDAWNAALVQRIVTSMQRRWRLPGRNLSQVLRVGRGIPQGCSMSVLVANLFISLLVKELHVGMEPSQVRVSAFCDDVIVMCKNTSDLNTLWTRVLEYVDLFGVNLNRKKSFAFTTSEETAAQWLRHGAVGQLPIKTTFVYLGVVLDVGYNIDETVYSEYAIKMLKKVRARLPRIQSLPLPLEKRAIIASSTVMAAASFAPFSWRVQPFNVVATRNSVIRAIQGGINPKMRAAKEVLLYIFCKGHRLDPVGAFMESSFKWMAHFIEYDRDSVQEVIEQQVPGVIHNLLMMCNGFGLQYLGKFAWCNSYGTTFDLEKELGAHAHAKVWHDWRAFIKEHIFASLQERRPRFHGILHMDRQRSLRLYHQLGDPMTKGAFRLLLTDGVLTAARLFKDEAHMQCSTCGCVEDTEHVFWVCPRWQHLRVVPREHCRPSEPATLFCGLLHKDPADRDVRIQKQLLDITGQYIAWRTLQGTFPDKRTTGDCELFVIDAVSRISGRARPAFNGIMHASWMSRGRSFPVLLAVIELLLQR